MSDQKGLGTAIETIPVESIDTRDLNELAYTLSETGLLPDEVDSISPEQLQFCWRAVEWLRRQGSFPDEYRM